MILQFENPAALLLVAVTGGAPGTHVTASILARRVLLQRVLRVGASGYRKQTADQKKVPHCEALEPEI